MVRENSLLTTAVVLWNEAVKSSEFLSLENPQKCQRDLERALKCLFAGLELVLPTVLEVKFRLKAASLLQKYTHNAVEACEQLRKALHLLQTRSDPGPLDLRMAVISAWCQCAPAAADKHTLLHLLEARNEAIHARELDWWMHFDWLALRKGRNGLLRDSLELLKDPPEEGCKLFLLVLLSCADPDLVLNQLEPLIMKDVESLEAWETIHVLAGMICLKERIERGELTDDFKRLFGKVAGSVDNCDGILPGRVRFGSKEVVRDKWIALSCTLSLRLGESPTPIVLETVPELVKALKGFESIPSDARNSKTKYSTELMDLLSLYTRTRISGEAQEIFSQCSSYTTSNPQMETLRLITMAIAQHNAAHPIHQVKTSLLAALKLINGVTQNAQMKILVLLLVGQLYMETDFDLAVKMNRAAYSFAMAAGWDLLGYFASKALSKVYFFLGDKKSSEGFAMITDKLKASVPSSCWRRLLPVEKQ